MKFSRLTLGTAVFAVAISLTQLVSANHHGHSKADAPKNNTIVDVAADAGMFNTLVTALTAAELVPVLEGAGPFTVLAPTDEAFAALPAGALDSLLADPAQLAEVLKLHVVSGRAMASDVVGLKSVDTVQGQTLAVNTTDGVSIGGATVIKTDIEASNGVIHVIDQVILPN